MLKIRVIMLGLAGWLAGSLFTLHSATLEENFATDPALRGWRSFGESSLFHWNATNQNLEVTWDSSYSNSYFYHPLGTVVAKDDDFGFSLDLRMRDMAIAVNPLKPNPFEIAIGLLNLHDAIQSNFVRGTQTNPLNLVEFTYFPEPLDESYSASICSTLVDSNHNWAYAWILQELTLDDLFHIEMNYAASNQTLFTTVTRNGQPYGTSTAPLDTTFLDFRVDAFSVSSYSDVGQDPFWSGSILAHGTIDNVVIAAPAPLVIPLTAHLDNGAWQVEFASRTNWLYRLQGTSDMRNWDTISSSLGNGGTLSLQDTNGHAAQFYRVVAERP